MNYYPDPRKAAHDAAIEALTFTNHLRNSAMQFIAKPNAKNTNCLMLAFADCEKLASVKIDDEWRQRLRGAVPGPQVMWAGLRAASSHELSFLLAGYMRSYVASVLPHGEKSERKELLEWLEKHPVDSDGEIQTAISKEYAVALGGMANKIVVMRDVPKLFLVSKATVKRAMSDKDNPLVSQRPPGARGQHSFFDSDLAKRWTRK